MTQIAFILWLYIFGILLGKGIRSKTPVWFLAPSAIFLGSTGWVIIGILTTLAAGKFNLLLTFALTFVVSLALQILASIKTKDTFSKKDWLYAGIGGVATALAAFVFTKFNITNATTDSLFIIRLGQYFYESGFSSMLLTSPTSYGVFVSMMQASALPLGYDYLFALHPVFSTSFLVFYFVFTFRKLSFIKNKWFRSAVILASLGLVFSSIMMRFQFSFIHTNLIAGIYLFIALASFSMFHSEKDEKWLFFAMAALTGFGLIRTENILFVLVLLILIVSYLEITFQQKLKFLLPYLAIFALWEFALMTFDAHNYKVMLDSQKLGALIGLLVVFMVMVVLTKVKWISEKVIPILPKLMVIGFCLVGVLFFILKPVLMFDSLVANLHALLLSGGWDATWYILIPLLIFVFLLFKKSKRNNLLKFVNTGFLLYYPFILFLVFFREPYYARWTDSANRMFVQVLFFALFAMVENFADANKISVEPEVAGESH
jgi:hypothetical protein